jgi:DNA-directed RNA polymerase subunit M/transcription elongation factor TFIIS
MEFCEKCGSSRTEIDIKNSKILCKVCGYMKIIESDQYKKKLPITYVKKKNEKEIVVLDEKYSEFKFKVTHKCQHCGNDKAYVQYIPPRWGDEDELTIYTCIKCGKSEREGFSR